LHWQAERSGTGACSYSKDELARTAFQIERQELGIPGGMQDQYAAVFGGMNLIEFSPSAVTVAPLHMEEAFLNELHSCLLLCYTGRTRVSAEIIRTQVDAYRRREAEAVAAMDALKAITFAMRDALLEGRLRDFGLLLHEAWENKKKMARQISDATIDRLYKAARENGALGGKILGAGGGGYLLFYCDWETRASVTEALTALGGQVIDFSFDPRGLHTWEVRPTGAVLGARCLALGRTGD
jgi:D-glycero-alpha-D-manno-heptose-7-phosphate kinase